MNDAATIAPAPQHLRALARANEVRLARAELKRRVSDGEVNAAEVIRDNPWEAASMTIAELLCAQRRWGSTRVRKFLSCIPMSETKTVGTMTDRQREAVAALLEDGAGAEVLRAAQPVFAPAFA
ncbi:hypothetical protein [Conexibacter sp. SYSU D00693]|uniref:hypothetical protein n=1 Tax=Conexibacter sp. SYSU D00693 TaxID=2812560 RepID=UPI00196B1CE2|nr:hypothetical protein [Conexibacter sp. SYSU D00693]